MNWNFWDRVDAEGDCWIWMAGKNGNGYGATYVDGRPGKVAHRWAYEALVGPIPSGLELDHLCRVKACVNPDHLEPVTHRENQLRAHNPFALNARKTHCPAGHIYDAANTHVRDGTRECKRCKYKRNLPYTRAWRARERAKRMAA